MGQNEKVVVKSSQKNDFLVLTCHNKTPYKVWVKFGLVDVHGLRGNLNPVTKLVPAKDSIVLKKLKVTGHVKYKYTFQKRFPQSVLAKREINLKDQPNLKKGIVVFNDDNCPRCHYALNYFLEHHIDFKMLNLKKPENNQLMWKMLRDSGFQGKGVDTPVILVDGKISYNHKHLKAFVKDLGK